MNSLTICTFWNVKKNSSSTERRPIYSNGYLLSTFGGIRKEPNSTERRQSAPCALLIICYGRLLSDMAKTHLACT